MATVIMRSTLPGIENEFIAVPKRNFTQRGTLGVVAIGLIAGWGSDTEAVELLSEDLVTGASLKKVGYTLTDEEILPYRLALTSAYKGYFYKLNSGGDKATKTIGSITFTAKYTGVVGNKIGITIIKDTPSVGRTTLKILVNGAIKENYILDNIADFGTVDSAWVDVTVATGGSDITEATNEMLAGGTNGTVDATTAYNNFFNAIKYKQFNVVAIQGTDSAISDKIIAFVNNLNTNKERLITGVVYNKPALNKYEIISVDQGCECDGFNVTTELFPILVASLRAGCPLNESLTKCDLSELIGARKIINPINDDDNVELENAIAQGRFALRYGNDGNVEVLQDINTLVNFTTEYTKEWSKNRHIAIAFYLVNEERRIAREKKFIGKYSNTAERRELIKADFLGVYAELYAMQAIKTYDPLTVMKIYPTDESDLVGVDQTIRPTDSIERMKLNTYVDFNMD